MKKTVFVKAKISEADHNWLKEQRQLDERFIQAHYIADVVARAIAKAKKKG